MSASKTATLTRITENGLGYFVDQISHDVFAFSFGRIAGYRGETREQLGLKPGVVVGYETDEKNS